MDQRMLHYIGGPMDGLVQLTTAESHPFVITVNIDTDGYYAVQYQVAGQQIGDLVLTQDDFVARWHQRNSADDFMTGDTVIVKATGARAMAFMPSTTVYEGGTSVSGWMIKTAEGSLIFALPDEIRVATAAELAEGDDAGPA